VGIQRVTSTGSWWCIVADPALNRDVVVVVCGVPRFGRSVGTMANPAQQDQLTGTNTFGESTPVVPVLTGLSVSCCQSFSRSVDASSLTSLLASTLVVALWWRRSISSHHR
jgi:hypothetical protein